MEAGLSHQPASLRFKNPPSHHPGDSGDAFPRQGVTVTEKKQNHELLADLERLFSAANTAVGNRIVLRDAICAYFNAERANGTSIEKIVLSVEEMLDRAEARAAGRPAGRDGQRELAQEFIDWCVKLDRSGNL